MVNEMELWDPFRKMRRMQKKMFDMFPSEDLMDIRQPLIDVVDKGKDIKVTAELPGMDKKNINLQVNDQSLLIKAETGKETKKDEEGYYFHERNYQKFFRQIPLPAEIVASEAKAEFKNGILDIRLPKKNPSKKENSHSIKIE